MLLSALTALVLALGAPAAPQKASPKGFYGPGFGGDELANSSLRGGERISYRFRSDQEGPLVALRPYFIWSGRKSGYNAGDGGRIRIELRPDDGTHQHHPGSPVLASLTHADPYAAGHWPRLVFPSPARLKAGTLYHLVFENVDAQPDRNYLSLNQAFIWNSRDRAHPSVADEDWMTLEQDGRAPWKPRRTASGKVYSPILELEYGNGAIRGSGYIEFWQENGKAIGGAAAVREAFTVSGGARTITAIHVRVWRESGTGPLVLKVADGAGSILATVRSEAVPKGSPGWMRLDLPSPVVLKEGQAYALLFTAPPGTLLRASAMRKGLDKGFRAATVFADGHAQFTQDGLRWRGWDMWGHGDRTDADLQFAFEIR